MFKKNLLSENKYYIMRKLLTVLKRSVCYSDYVPPTTDWILQLSNENSYDTKTVTENPSNEEESIIFVVKTLQQQDIKLSSCPVFSARLTLLSQLQLCVLVHKVHHGKPSSQLY